MFISPITVVVIAATALGGAMAVPQAWKVLRSRSVRGVSGSWSAISATLNAWWAVYAVGTEEWAIFPVAAISVMAYLVITAAIVRFSDDRSIGPIRSMATSSIAIGVVPLAALLAGGWVVAGIVLGALYGVQLSPAVVAVYRSVDVSGVSLATWMIAFAEAVLWGFYGVARVDPGIAALAVTGSVASALVIVRLLVRRPRPERRLRTALAPA